MKSAAISQYEEARKGLESLITQFGDATYRPVNHQLIDSPSWKPLTDRAWRAFIKANTGKLLKEKAEWEEWIVHPDQTVCSRFHGHGDKLGLAHFQRLANTGYLLLHQLRSLAESQGLPKGSRIDIADPQAHGNWDSSYGYLYWLRIVHETGAFFPTLFNFLHTGNWMAPTPDPEVARPTTPLDLEMAAADRRESFLEKTRTVGGVTFPAHPFVETLQHDVFRSSAESIKLWLNPQRADSFQMGYWDDNTPPVYLPSISTEGAPVVMEKRSRPRWDNDAKTLYYGDVIIKKYKQPAAAQVECLQAFHIERWRKRIHMPLAPVQNQEPKRRLRLTVYELNQNHVTPDVIRFIARGLDALWIHVKPN